MTVPIYSTPLNLGILQYPYFLRNETPSILKNHLKTKKIEL